MINIMNILFWRQELCHFIHYYPAKFYESVKPNFAVVSRIIWLLVPTSLLGNIVFLVVHVLEDIAL